MKTKSRAIEPERNTTSRSVRKSAAEIAAPTQSDLKRFGQR